MITPEKHLDLNHCVLRAGAEVLSYLRRERVASVAKLRDRLVRAVGADADVVFHSSLNFLFLVGRIDYHPQADRFEYLESRCPKDKPEGGTSA